MSSNSYTGGSETFATVSTPLTETDALQVLKRFIQNNFSNPDETISRLEENDGSFVLEADSSQYESPATLENDRDDQLKYYGAFISPASNHSIQRIWEYHFEVREADNGDVFVRVSDWFGTTPETWSDKVNNNDFY